MSYVQVKVRRATIIALFISGLAIGWLIGSPMNGPSVATIGGNEVPDLDCQEDEVIAFDQTSNDVPRPLACVHFEDATR